ncbi:glycoside hydrolase family 38 N-terminal domain-containing protein [Bacteroides sp.]
MKKILIIIFTVCLVSMNAIAQKNYFKKGTVNFAPSSHQDIAWMNVPDTCTEFRIEKLLMPSIRLLEKEPSYCFTMEYALTLEEFLNKYPERKSEILELTAKKRLDWGATFNQPYESLLSGEALVRETYLGKRWLQQQLPGCEFLTAFNPDVPGRSLQTSQILSKAGIKYSVISRFEPGVYRWFSPDGSSILCKSNGIYCDYARTLAGKKEVGEKKEYIRSIVDFWSPYYEKHKLNSNLFFLSTDDNEEPYNYSAIFRDLSAEKGMPEFRYSTVSTAMSAIAGKNSKITDLMGEWPDLWLYIHNPTHRQAISAMRNAQRQLVNVEKFSTIRALLRHSFADYPQSLLTEAWKCSIYPDHGWGGNGGNITDDFFKNKLKKGEQIANELLGETLKDITLMIRHTQEGKPIVVFNPQGWMRTDIVIASINVYGADKGRFVLTDDSGKEIPYQYASMKGNTEDGDVQIVFRADSIPPIGYKSFYFKHVADTDVASLQPEPGSTDIENSFYKIEFVPGGIKRIYDKALGRELLQTDKFLGGEVFCTRSEGNGAGEFTAIQPIAMDGFEKTSDYAPVWNIIERGRVREVRELRTRFKYATVTQRVIVYHDMPKIDFEVDIEGFTGEAYREFRMTFPLNQKQSLVSYEVPMGVVEVGKTDLAIPAGHAGGLNYATPCNETPLRECQDWFASSDANSNIMISSSVGVFGYKDVTENPVSYPILQPVLLASRKSCHWVGNWYLQQGNHSYRFTLHSSAGDWHDTYHSATQAAQPVLVVAATGQGGEEGMLPPVNSFFRIDKKNVMISTIKKCEDDDQIIVRFVDMEGKDTDIQFESFQPFMKCVQTNIIEEPIKNLYLKEGKLAAKIGHHAIETYKLSY